MKQTLKDLSLILFGGLIFSIGMTFFTIPNYLSEGGVIGITVVLHYVFDWSPGIITFVINFALILVGLKFFKSKRTTLYTIFTIVSSSFILYILEDYNRKLTNDTLLAAIFAGLFIGIGVSLIFRAGGTIGGTTILARLFNQYFGISMGNFLLITDIIVVTGSLFVIGIENGMYTIICVYVGIKIINYLVDGMDERVAVFIMSNHSERIRRKVIQQMARGITVLDGEGGYSGNNKKILYIVISKKELVSLKELIKDIDKDAYVTVHEVQEVIRKGYKAV